MRPHAVGGVLGSRTQPDGHLHVLEAAELGGHRAEDLGLPAHPLGVTLVHSQQISREEGRFLAALPRLDFDDGVAGVVGVAGNERVFEGGLGLRMGFLQTGQLGAE